jgi:eukaryotic-like serine/threonine-protein kinase
VADEIIIDEYTLLNHIATGSSTQVWEVVEKGSGDKHSAMKLMLPEALLESQRKQVLKHEAKLAERFDHPNIVRFEKLVMNKKRAYMVMEYFRAPNLKMQLQSDILSLQVRIARLFEQLCQALGYLHDQGWVHRDIKPDNVLFNKASELRLIDFSLTTRAAGAVSKLIGGKRAVIQGTRTYISPETILKAPPSPQADIYSLGVTLFEILAGEPPFRGTSPDDLLKKHLTTAAPPPSFFNDNVTPEMDRFVLKMLAKRTKDRHKNTHELLAEFRNIKPFKEDAAERDRRRKHEQEERYKSTLDKSGRLDSRADHLKQRFLKANPDEARAEAEKKKALAKEEAEKKQAAAKRVGKLTEDKAAPAKPAPAAPAASSATRAAAPAAAPAPPQPPPMHGYPAGYGYPGHMPAPYPMAGYPPGAGYPPMPGGYPQPAGYPQPGGYLPGTGYPSAPGYPGGGYAPPGYSQPGYPQPGYPPQQPPMQMPQPPGSYAPGSYPPGQPPPGYPSGVPGQPYGAVPYGNQGRLPTGNPPPGAAPPQAPPTPRAPATVPRPNATPAQPAIDEQQQLLQQLLGQPAAPPAGAPKPAARPATPQPPSQRPAAQSTGQELPLMDQLPPVK